MAEPILDQEVAEYLKTQGFGNLFSDKVPRQAKKLFVGEEPDSPDNIITVVEGGGSAPIITFGEERSFTVRTRDDEYIRGKTVSQKVHRALHFKEGILSGVQVALIQADTNPIYLGRDGNRRHVWTQTFTAVTKAIEEG